MSGLCGGAGKEAVTMAPSDRVTCSKCGRLAPRSRALGINGAWLCGRCLKDQTALDEFLDVQLARIGRALRRAIVLTRRGR